MQGRASSLVSCWLRLMGARVLDRCNVDEVEVGGIHEMGGSLESMFRVDDGVGKSGLRACVLRRMRNADFGNVFEKTRDQ